MPQQLEKNNARRDAYGSQVPVNTNWHSKVLEMEKQAREAEQRHNAIIDEQRKVISTLIIRPTTQTPQSFGTPIRKQKHSEITSPLQSHGKKIRYGGKLLFNQLPEFRQRPTRFQTHQLGKKAATSGNRRDPENEIASQKSATIVGNTLNSQSGTPLPAILSPNACWNMPERDSSEAFCSPKPLPLRAQTSDRETINATKSCSVQLTILLPTCFATYLPPIFLQYTLCIMTSTKASRYQNQYNVHRSKDTLMASFLKV